MIPKLLVKHKYDILFLVILGVTLPLFFYKLGQTSLTSFDEAWYASIAHNLAKDGDVLNLSWGDNQYVDHPPFGFLVMAIVIRVFGEHEFWIRFPSAILGFSSLVVTYFLGREIFNKWVGFASAIALSSAFWFMFRARSGNLDIPLTFFFLLTIFLVVKARGNKKYLIWLSFSMVCLFLTKTLVPFTIIPVLFLIFLRTKLRINHSAASYGLKDFVLPSLILLFLVGGWFAYQTLKDPTFINYYFKIGLPGVGIKTDYLFNIGVAREYLHSGIGKWFWPGIFSVLCGAFLLQKRFLILSVFFVGFLLPFILSERGQIWHLIPVYPIMILSFFGLTYVLLEKLINIFPKKVLRVDFIPPVVVLSLSLYFSILQVRQSWYQFIDVPAFVSDEAILSREAGRYPYKFYVDGDFVPVAIFYSGKSADQISATILNAVFEEEEPFVMITKQWRLNGADIPTSKYEILKSDRDRILILKK